MEPSLRYDEGVRATTCRETAPCPWAGPYRTPGTASGENLSLPPPGRAARRAGRAAGPWPCWTWRRWGGTSTTTTAASGTLPPAATRRGGPSRTGRSGTFRPRPRRAAGPGTARRRGVRPAGAGSRRSRVSRPSPGPSRGPRRPGCPGADAAGAAAGGRHVHGGDGAGAAEGPRRRREARREGV